MNFKISRFLSLTFNFIFGTFFFFLGLFAVIFPWAPKIKQATVFFLLEDTLILSLFGLAFALVGCSIVIYALLNSRKKYLCLRIGPKALTINETVIKQYLESYWIENFPNASIFYDLILKPYYIEVIAELPAVPLREQKIFMEKIKADLKDLFGRVIGYSHEIRFFAHFQPTKRPQNES